MTPSRVKSCCNKLAAAILATSFSCGLAGCSSNQVPTDAKLLFQTRITSTGLKHFQLAMILPARQQTIFIRPGSQQSDASRRNESEGKARAAERILQHALEEKISESAFCREGYWLLDHDYHGFKSWLRGECNETATEADRKNFPDTLLNW